MNEERVGGSGRDGVKLMLAKAIPLSSTLMPLERLLIENALMSLLLPQ